ncbi:unnamed protein product [Acanthoscelides obtectus]|uniref:SERTA domain-containing protein n=1 Tax=Acanthoscelides obtectus TaxID=200917 RepID=A0A9P0KA37_ACAOB|nr:unnamed protein product [Acanthoscelides obtectus]CAK1623076.1 hypothetical protein AOBTE_LOCUS1803 [Acanthoscelides obtectus]
MWRDQNFTEHNQINFAMMGVQAMHPPSTGPPAAVPPGSKRKITEITCPSGPPEAKTARWDTPDHQTMLWDTLEANNKNWDSLEAKNKSWDKSDTSTIRREASGTERCRKNGSRDFSEAKSKPRDISKNNNKNEECRLTNSSSLENDSNRLNGCLERLQPSQEEVKNNSNSLDSDNNAWDRFKPPTDDRNVSAINRLNGSKNPLQRNSKNWGSLKLSQDEENVRWERRKSCKLEAMNQKCNNLKSSDDSRNFGQEGNSDTSIKLVTSAITYTTENCCVANKDEDAVLTQDAKDVTWDTTNKMWDSDCLIQDTKYVLLSDCESQNENWDVSETNSKQWENAILTKEAKDVRWNGTDNEESGKNSTWESCNVKNMRWESTEDCIARLRAVAIPVNNWRSPVNPKGTLVSDEEYEDDDFEDELSSDDDKVQEVIPQVRFQQGCNRFQSDYWQYYRQSPQPQQTIRREENGKSYLELGAAPLIKIQPHNSRLRCCDSRGRWCHNPCYRQRRLTVLNMSMCKLARYRQCSDPSLRRSVLICNTLRRLEREMETEPTEAQYHHPSSEPFRMNSSRNSQDQLQELNQQSPMRGNNSGSSCNQQQQTRNSISKGTQQSISSMGANTTYGVISQGSTSAFKSTSGGSTFYEQSLREMTSGRATPFPSGTLPDTDSGLGEDEAMLNKPINWSSVLSLSSQTETDIEVLNNKEFYEEFGLTCSESSPSSNPLMSLGNISNEFISSGSTGPSVNNSTFIGLSSFQTFPAINGTTSPIAISMDDTDLLEDYECGDSTRTFLTLENVNDGSNCTRSAGNNGWDRYVHILVDRNT